MLVLDQEHTSFITDCGLYCYKVMPFGLKNARTTYQCLVNMMFIEQIGKTMNVYVDDMLVKSKAIGDHVTHLSDTFAILRRYRMKLKCALGVASEKFLSFMVNQGGIEANPEKIQALIDIQPPSKMNEVQSLIERVAALSRFILRATNKCLPFFDSLKGNKRFLWDDKCEQAFRSFKKYLSKPSPLSKLVEGEPVFLYLAVTEYTISRALVREEDKVQWPVYYVNKQLVDAERYPEMDKLALALVITLRKLRPYFHSHLIWVFTNYPLRQVLQKPDSLGRLLMWAIELSQFKIEFQPRPVIKGQALVDFIANFSHKLDERPEKGPSPSTP